MRRAIFAAAIVMQPAGALAVTALDICIHTENDLDRLACYDRVSGRTPKLALAPSKGKWLVRTETSAMTDQTNVYLSVQSDEVVDCGWNQGDTIDLTLRCMENATSLIFTTGCHMASSDYNSYGDVDYRIDDQKARTIGMVESTDNRALGLWSGARAIPEIQRLFGASRLIVRMTPFSENPFTATFDISGVEEASKPLREACGW